MLQTFYKYASDKDLAFKLSEVAVSFPNIGSDEGMKNDVSNAHSQNFTIQFVVRRGGKKKAEQ